MIETILQSSEHVRYVAIYSNGDLAMQTKLELNNASSEESDKYEELLVNPAMLMLASQRGEIDCGGLEYLLIRYGNFFQLVIQTSTGHLSVAISADTNPMPVVEQILALVNETDT